MLEACISLAFLFLAWPTSVSSTPLLIDSCSRLQTASHIHGLSESVQFNASFVDAGALTFPNVTGVNDHPVCRVMGTITYGVKNNSTLRFELWLPRSSKYNGRYLSVGNGGYAGSIQYGDMLEPVNSGYAVGGSDGGHSLSANGPNAPGGYVEFMHNRDETLAWIHNAVAMFTVPAKQLTTVYYGKAPKKTYYAGCSTGGAQGFALAQYHPEVFDGIFAGSPGNYYSYLILSFLWNGLSANKTDSYLSQTELDIIKDAVMKECDGIDGVYDGVLENPWKCKFDISSLRCDSNKVTGCLSPEKIRTAELIYSGPRSSITGESIYPGFAFGSESEWIVQEESLYLQYAVPILQNMVFGDLSYDYKKFDWASDLKRVDKLATPFISAISPDLRAFEGKGGKLIVTQGWADPFNAPGWPIQQRDEMHELFGDKLHDFYSLFMVPGGGHCGGARSYPQVPGTWHTLDALVQWVENGRVPQEVLASNPADGSNTTRKLCPYPKEAVHVSGSADEWTSYACQ